MAINQNLRQKLVWMCSVAMLTALTVVCCSFHIPVPGGSLFLVDVPIVTASIILGPIGGLFVGGIGAFLGDLFFYPMPMFVSLVVHGLQGLVVGLFARYTFKKKPIIGSSIGSVIGGIILVVGYTIGRIYFYSEPKTPAVALAKLPFEALQAIIGIVVALFLCYVVKLPKIYNKIVGRN